MPTNKNLYFFFHIKSMGDFDVGELIEVEDMDISRLLGIAIRLEMDAQDDYDSLLNMNISSDLKETIKRLKEKEVEHEKSLREVFEDFYPGEEPDTGTSFSAHSINALEGEDVVTLLEHVMEEEKRAEEFYEKLSYRLEGPSQKLVSYLSYTEREHYEILKREVEKYRDSEPP